MKLLIVESPAKAKTINKYLSKDFKVISSYGHIRGLPSEKGAVEPERDFMMRYEINDKAVKHVEEIVTQAAKSSELYLATDPDREGESISYHIVEVLRERKVLKKDVAIKRVVFHEITKKAVLEAIQNSRSLDANLVKAQQTRQALDYLVGFNLSPVLWRKLPGSRSAGRVQSVALRMICDREAEIEKFKEEEYWTIETDFANQTQETFQAQLVEWQGNKIEKFSISNEKAALEIIEAIGPLSFTVANITKKQMKRSPNPPFTTATLIQEASRKLGFGAHKTAQVAQKLYEGVSIDGELVGLITYVRTDSVNVSIEAIDAARTLIKQKYGCEFVPASPRIYKTKTKNAQEAHEAIRPTDIAKAPHNIKSFLGSDHFKLYELIWKRLVASQMTSAILDIVNVEIESSEKLAVFRASGSTFTFPGFYKVYREGSDDKEGLEEQNLLPDLNIGKKTILLAIKPLQHFTQPPPRYTEASLVKQMEELGIGRPSTYASIISILQDREYVTLDKRRFIAQPRGRLVTAFLAKFFPKYVEYNFTAELEDQLDEVASGGQDWKKLMSAFWYPFKAQTEEALKIQNTEVLASIERSLQDYIFKHHSQQSASNDSNQYDKSCPECKEGQLELKTSKFGSFIGCSNYPTCNYSRKLTSHLSPEANQASNHDKLATPIILGTNSEEGQEVSVRKGPYGAYIQLGEGAEARRAAIPQDLDPTAITLSAALKFLKFPKVLGSHPESGLPVKVGIGRFGPYVECNKVYASINKKSKIDVTEVDLTTAINLIDAKIKKGPSKRKKTASSNKPAGKKAAVKRAPAKTKKLLRLKAKQRLNLKGFYC